MLSIVGRTICLLCAVLATTALTSACKLLPADPLASDIAIRRDGQQLEIAIALCPDEQISGLSVSPYSDPETIGSPALDGTGSAEAVPGSTAQVIQVGQLDAPSVRELAPKDELTFIVETTFTEGTSRTNSFSRTRADLDQLADGQWSGLGESAVEIEKMSASGCDRPDVLTSQVWTMPSSAQAWRQAFDL